MFPVAQDGFDAQVRTSLLDFVKRFPVEGIHHGHSKNSSQLVNRQKTQPQTQFFGNLAEHLLVNIIVQQAETRYFELLDEVLVYGLSRHKAF